MPKNLPIQINFISNGAIVQGFDLTRVTVTPQGNQPEQKAIFASTFEEACDAIKQFWPGNEPTIV